MAGALYLKFHVLQTACGVCGSSDVAPGHGCGTQVPLKLLQTEGIGVGSGQLPPTCIKIDGVKVGDVELSPLYQGSSAQGSPAELGAQETLQDGNTPHLCCLV